jgi:hypothetical protein
MRQAMLKETGAYNVKMAVVASIDIAVPFP